MMAKHARYNLKNQALMADVYAEAIKIINGPSDRFWMKRKDRNYRKYQKRGFVCPTRVNQSNRSAALRKLKVNK
jgi:hypothetical protein